MKRCTVILAALLAAVAAPSPAHADTTEAEQVVVTATRTAQTVDDSLASVSVITREDIERNQAENLSELLSGYAGIDFAVSGGYGKTTDFFLRGTSPGHTLVLIDGVKVGSATLGSMELQLVPLSQVERIEVVRGPRSSLYGSEAVGGVIQIFTRRGEGPLRAEVEAGYGRYVTRQFSAGISGESDRTSYYAHAGRFNTAGFDAQKNGVLTPSGPTPDEPDNDGYLNNSFSTGVGHRFAGGAEAHASFAYNDGDTRYDGYYNRSRFSQQVLSADVSFSPVSAWRIKLAGGESRDATEDYHEETIVLSRIATRRRTASWQNDFTLSEKQMLTLGTDYLGDHITSDYAYAKTSRRDTAAFLQYQGNFEPVAFSLSLRQDDNEVFGKYRTGNLALGYDATPALRLTASYGKAFKAPTFNGLYWPYSADTWFGTTYITQGNPDLVPEESRTSELGARYRFSPRTRIGLNVFRNRIRNLIDWVTTQTGATTYTTMPRNTNNAVIRGAELQAETERDDWTARASCTWLDPRDSDTGNILQRRARRTFRLDMDRNVGAWRMGAEWLVQGERYNDQANTVHLGGYGIVNLHSQYDVNERWSVHARVDNAFDKQYETVATYNNPGRSAFVLLTYRTR